MEIRPATHSSAADIAARLMASVQQGVIPGLRDSNSTSSISTSGSSFVDAVVAQGSETVSTSGSNDMLSEIMASFRQLLESIMSNMKGENAADMASLSGTPPEFLPETGETDLEAILAQASLDHPGQVNEEELFAAVIRERLGRMGGAELSDRFATEFSRQMDSLRRPDGYVSVEKAAGAALQTLVDEGVIDAGTAERINAQAFLAAQLDQNQSTLFDGRGSADDPTVAAGTISDAVESARSILAQIDSGQIDPGTRTLGQAEMTTPQGTRMDGSEGFVFKPQSDHGRKLVVLLPQEFANQVAGIVLKDANGEVVEEGRSSGYANGGREHFRFGKAGGAYPKNLTVEVQMQDGSTRTYAIPDPSQRYD